LDELKHVATKLEKAENQIEKYKQRFEEAAELQKQYKVILFFLKKKTKGLFLNLIIFSFFLRYFKLNWRKKIEKFL